VHACAGPATSVDEIPKFKHLNPLTPKWLEGVRSK
jgi:hypothetical protein